MSELGYAFRLYAAQKGLCFHCGQMMTPRAARYVGGKGYGTGWTREHIIPVSRGGSRSTTENVVLAHGQCNGARGSRPFTEEELIRAKQVRELAKSISKQHELWPDAQKARRDSTEQTKWAQEHPLPPLFYPTENDPKFVPPPGSKNGE